MVHSFGYRSRTRDLFSRPFRKHGPPNVSTYLQTFKLGEYVDVVGNGAIHKGMPYKFYHGKTGRIWNITPRAVGVLINKTVRQRVIQKKIHVRIEHVRKSRCQEDLKKRNDENNAIKAHNKKNPSDKKQFIKRLPEQPREGEFVKKTNILDISPDPYRILA